MLYNLKDDIGETTNIAQKEPAQVAKMLARLKVRPDPAGPSPPPASRAEPELARQGWYIHDMYV